MNRQGCEKIKANQKFKGLVSDKSGYTQVVGGLIALLVTIGVGALVYWEITDNFDGTSAEANDSMDATNEMATTVFELLPIIALVAVAGIIIGIVVQMGGGRV